MEFCKSLTLTFGQLKRLFRWANHMVSFSTLAFLCPELIWKSKKLLTSFVTWADVTTQLDLTSHLWFCHGGGGCL